MQLFNWIMEDECISREAIHSLARRDLPIDDPNNKPAWDTRDLSLWVGKWLPESCPENTLNTALPALGNSLDQCRLWASTYQGTGNPLDIEFFHFFGLWDPATQTIVYRTRHGFQVFANPEDPAAESISNRPVGRHPGSNTNLKRVSSWLQNCQEHHNCEVIPGAIPARVIEVTGTPDAINMRLCSTDHLGPVPYACLSYCWGGEQERKCTASNIASYQTAIPFEEQPATIRDSARVYLGIGLRYLWIDALCIIQDDPNDKPVEIAKMPSIYGGANITIVAARSSSSTAGFLGERFPGRLEAARISYRCIDGQLGSVTLAKLGGGFESVEPIDERGWTLQERLLSLRIVEFGSRQTRWICPETRSSKSANEGLTDGWRRNADYNRKRKTEGLNLDVIRTAKTTIDFYGRPRASRFHEYLTAMDHWEKICATFTARALTLSSDRAMAIAGVAQIFADFSGDRYVAGLWKSCFHSGLLWSIDHSYTYPRNFARPLMYQGPSWSWLAVNGTVRFARVHGAADCVAEILSVETEPATATAPFGLVRPGSGRLVLCARAVLGVRKRVPLRSPGTFRDEVAIIGVKKPVLCFAIAKLHFDVQGEEMDEDEEEAGCLLVEIVRSSNLGSLSFQGLVLRWSSPERKTYSRIGVFSLSGRRKGTLCEEFLEEGGPSEEDFNCFPDKARVIEII
ncbi:heterokaryon incompatibility protein-domain-containing protein [Schizothecium vesticola]|uniref:Heterokaryon incompatibility protein-domain-containing protein n=1 Tax=Schizothecium vesticola TaxID=314040 RepID=A0AA40ENY1_9PEZI|nr:heterokaryon incompatibility protein-domain-containing protein [Schizothecium vesticola]